MNITDLNGIVIVTGTDTDVGKTVTTAVIASALKQSGKDVTIIKPYQTGLDHDEPGDVHDAGRLASIDAVIGSWPDRPDLAERCNLEEIEDAAGAPLVGVIPAGIGKDPEAVQQTARNLGETQ